MDKIAVLIPCYNEALTINKVITDWKRELPEAIIYVYDNNFRIINKKGNYRREK